VKGNLEIVCLEELRKTKKYIETDVLHMKLSVSFSSMLYWSLIVKHNRRKAPIFAGYQIYITLLLIKFYKYMKILEVIGKHM